MIPLGVMHSDNLRLDTYREVVAGEVPAQFIGGNYKLNARKQRTLAESMPPEHPNHGISHASKTRSWRKGDDPA